jgi:hypothetical protein
MPVSALRRSPFMAVGPDLETRDSTTVRAKRLVVIGIWMLCQSCGLSDSRQQNIEGNK